MIERIEISQEQKENIISQIESFCGKRPLFYLKFASCEKYAEDIINGKLFSNTPEYFRQQELKTCIRGQGDRFELLNIIEATEIIMRDCETDDEIMRASQGTVTIRFKDDDTVPLVCFVGIPLADMELIYLDDTHADFLFPFTEEEYKTMKDKFGEYCVIMEGLELERKIKLYAQKVNCEYIFDKIHYCKPNVLNRFLDFNKASSRRFLYKNEDLSYQREYRLALACEIPSDHFINIGAFDNATIFKSDSLKNLVFTLTYVSHQIESE